MVAIYLVCANLKGISSMKLHRDMDVSQKTAWFMLHRIREAFINTDDPLFAGPVEADETFIGGKVKNMHESKRRARGSGRGTAGKIAVAGVKDRASNRVAAQPVSDTTSATLTGRSEPRSHRS